MIVDKELSSLMQSIAEKSLKLIAELKAKANKKQLPVILDHYAALTKQYQNLMQILVKNPDKYWEFQMQYWQDALNLAQEQFTHWLNNTPMPIKDKRFSDDAWVKNPFFNVLSQQYLLASQHMNSFLEELSHSDKKGAKKLQFFTQQYLDALSPANFVYTNPEIMAETIQTKGKNLLQGLDNFLTDLDTDAEALVIKMTDTNAFKVGVNLANTPGKVIFRNKMMELIQYKPQTKKTYNVPLLMIPPWINKYYILDLGPQKSLIRWLVKKGITVFVISWANPDASFAKKTLFDYLKNGPRTAIQVIKKQLAVKEVNTLGFCIGGTLMALLLAYNKAKKDKSIRSASFLASMIDFSDPGDIGVFIDEQQVKSLEKEMKTKGYLAGRFMANSFNSLRANDLIWSHFVKNYLSGKKPVPFDILFWNADSTNMPSTMHSQYLRWMYLHNDLIKPGKIHLNNVSIDVTQIHTPTFFLSTIGDHIAPWKTTWLGYQLMKGPKCFILGGSGHIAGVINPPMQKKYNYLVNNCSAFTAEEWLESAIEHTGSWWPEWFKWLKSYSGELINAPKFKNLYYPGLMAAPGSYVLKKAE